VRVVGDDAATETAVTNSAKSLGLDTRLTALRDNSTTLGDAEIVSLVASPKFTNSPLLASAIVSDLEAARQTPTSVDPGAVDPAPGTTTNNTPLVTLDRTAVLQVAERFSDPSVGEGLQRLTEAAPDLATNKAAVAGLAATGTTLQVDQIARTLPADQLKAFASDIAIAAATGDSKQVASVLAKASTVRRLQ
jgi:hypothetical protein